MTKRALPWALFLVSILLISFFFFIYLCISELNIISLLDLLVFFLSILAVRQKWRNRQEPPGKSVQASSDAGDRFLQRLRRWHYGDEKNPH